MSVEEIDNDSDMSQRQPRRRPQGQGEAPQQVPDQPITYGDVFDVFGELAGQPVAPRDAAVLQSAEQAALGRTQRGGPAAVMQSAAALNARAGHVGKGEITGPAAEAGATVTEAEIPGRRVVAESVGGQVVARFVTPARVEATHPAGALGQDAVTVGRALEAVAATAAGDRPVEQSDAAAVQAAADHNARAARGEDKVKLRDVLSKAREKLPADKGATGEDAERVVSAEIRNKLDMATTPGGVAEAVTTAARLNQERP
ncbi:unnamed protein product [Urochloa decumbens]|uniref:SMP domain-containing protein n=1 Tax=Urochloa decumbens TaxID=240449 RepID=A0ABC8Y2P3_9POAL